MKGKKWKALVEKARLSIFQVHVFIQVKCHTNSKQLLRRHKGKLGKTYQPLSNADNVTKILNGWSESLLHVAAKKNGGRG